MRAMSTMIMDDEPEEIEGLLPWYAAGTLSVLDAQRVAEALKQDAGLRRQYAAIQEEYTETIDLNESLGAPSASAMQKLFAAIDAEPARKAGASVNRPSRFGAFFGSLSPRTLAWSASFGALALVLQAGVIGTILMRDGLDSFQSAAYREQVNRPSAATGNQATPPSSGSSQAVAPSVAVDSTTRERTISSAPPLANSVSEPAPAAPPEAAPPEAAPPEAALPKAALPKAELSRAEPIQSNEQPPGTSPQAARAPTQKLSRSLGANRDVVLAVTFRPDARMSDISALLGSYHAMVIGNEGGTFRLQFEGMTTANDRAVLLSALRNERIVAAAAP